MESKKNQRNEIVIHRPPTAETRRIQRHERIDKTLTAIVGVVGLAWMVFTGIDYLSNQKQIIIPYHEDIRALNESYNPINILQDIFAPSNTNSQIYHF